MMMCHSLSDTDDFGHVTDQENWLMMRITVKRMVTMSNLYDEDCDTFYNHDMQRAKLEDRFAQEKKRAASESECSTSIRHWRPVLTWSWPHLQPYF